MVVLSVMVMSPLAGVMPRVQSVAFLPLRFQRMSVSFTSVASSISDCL